jgi:hypothetical protein
MTHLATRTGLVFFVLLGASVSSAWAKDRSCDRCGGHQGVERVCRPLTTVKYVTNTCWDFATEDFCIPRKCRDGCSACGCVGVAETAADKHIESCDAKPRDAKPRDDCTCGYEAVPKSRNRLLKKTCVTRVPVTVWVVEYVCEACGRREKGAGDSSDDKTCSDEPPVPKRLAKDPFVDDPSADDGPEADDEIEIPPAPVIPAPPR